MGVETATGDTRPSADDVKCALEILADIPTLRRSQQTWAHIEAIVAVMNDAARRSDAKRFDVSVGDLETVAYEARSAANVETVAATPQVLLVCSSLADLLSNTFG